MVRCFMRVANVLLLYCFVVQLMVNAASRCVNKGLHHRVQTLSPASLSSAVYRKSSKLSYVYIYYVYTFLGNICKCQCNALIKHFLTLPQHKLGATACHL